MGDYTKTGVKIGTCGKAYYATKSMLEKIKHDPEAAIYLDPKNKCSFAFPFPKYDNKEIGEISQFHSDQRAEFYFDIPATSQSWHDRICLPFRPSCGGHTNLFTSCPQSIDAIFFSDDNKKFTAAGQKPKTHSFRLAYQTYYDGKLHIVACCSYCDKENIFDAQEAEDVCKWIESRVHTKQVWNESEQCTRTIEDTEAKEYYFEIAKRIRETYK